MNSTGVLSSFHTFAILRQMPLSSGSASRVVSKGIMRNFVVAGALAVLIAGGCSSGASTKSVNSDEFPALRELSMDTLMMIGPDASMGKWAVVRKGAASKEFGEKVGHFESATLPSGIADGAALKEKTVKALQALITAARTNGDNATMEAAWKDVQTAVGNLNAAAEGKKAG